MVDDEIIVVASLLELKTRSVHDAIVCVVCETSKTSYWRKDLSGRTLCNACGIYQTRHRIDRPIELWNTPKKKL